MLRSAILAVLSLLPLFAAGEQARDLAAAVSSLELDPDACYRVNDLRFTREDLSVYFNHGYLIFAKPVHGIRPGAVFDAESDTGDAEVLVLPPNRAERLSMTRFTGAPNLDTHFRSALLIFSDATAGELLREMQKDLVDEAPRKDPEMGVKLAAAMSASLRRVYMSYEVRIVHDMLSPPGPKGGFLVLAMAGSRFGVFDALYEPSPDARVIVGQPAERNGHGFFNIWTSFPARSARETAVAPVPPLHVSKFTIDAAISANLSMSVTSRLSFEANREVGGAISVFISPEMHVSGAVLDGEPAEVLQSNAALPNTPLGSHEVEFLVVPPHPVSAGKHELEIRHEGRVIAETADHIYFVGARGVWYPQFGDEQADFDITYRYPKRLEVVTTGDVVENRVDGDSRITRAVTAAPIRFAGFNLGDYARVKVTRGPYTIELCANRNTLPPPSLPPPQSLIHPPVPPLAPSMHVSDTAPNGEAKDRLETLAFNTAAAFSFMANMLGPPHIRSMTVSPIPGTFGQGFPGLIYLSTLAYLDPSQRPAELRTRYNDTFFSEILEAHEIAHQWWGNLVVPAAPQDDWLMESLANYSALLYLEKRKGPEAVAAVLEDYKQHLLTQDARGRTVESTGPIIWGIRLQTSDAPEGWRVITYEKGSWIIHMLRQQLGDERFLAFLREACERYKSEPLGTEQFRALAGKFMPSGAPDASLENFFENWVYGTGIPALRLTYTVQGTKLTGSLTQVGVGSEFTAWVPVSIRDGSRARIKWVQTGSDASTFTETVKQPSSRAELPESWLYTVAPPK